MGHEADKQGDDQWIEHILNRMYLIGEARRKRQTMVFQVKAGLKESRLLLYGFLISFPSLQYLW